VIDELVPRGAEQPAGRDQRRVVPTYRVDGGEEDLGGQVLRHRSDKWVTERLEVRRIPEANTERNKAAGQVTLSDAWRTHAFFTTTDPGQLDTRRCGQDPRRYSTR